ncbi:MAG: hypothetical protein LBL62_03430 [Planctomycetaceae bacterium]|jgi:hypothetical protein|nr:hypothetical protein [Planctomycetaceae bacterium]
MRYTQAVLKFTKLITEAQQREAVTRGRSLLPYRLRYSYKIYKKNVIFRNCLLGL